MKWTVKSQVKLSYFLQKRLEGVSGKFIRKALAANLCRINGKVERFASTFLSAGDVIELSSRFQSIFNPIKNNLEVLFEHEDFIIANKPSGFICSGGNSFLKPYKLIHRLDKDTTGLLILAKSSKGKNHLIELFKSSSISKSYLAIVDGAILKRKGIINSSLIKTGFYQGQTIWGSSPNEGLRAITQYKVLEIGKKASLVLVKPITGRTHQIRVHMAEIGHPILIDPQYARRYRSSIISSRPLLHAFRLQFEYQEQKINVSAPIPKDFIEASEEALIRREIFSLANF